MKKGIFFLVCAVVNKASKNSIFVGLGVDSVAGKTAKNIYTRASLSPDFLGSLKTLSPVGFCSKYMVEYYKRNRA